VNSFSSVRYINTIDRIKMIHPLQMKVEVEREREREREVFWIKTESFL